MKKCIISFILGAIIFGSIGVVASTLISADKISYDENTTIKEKIDDLYGELNIYQLRKTKLTATYQSTQGNRIDGRTVNINLIPGQYLLFTVGSFTIFQASSSSDNAVSSSPTVSTNKCESLNAIRQHANGTTKISGDNYLGTYVYENIFLCDIDEETTVTVTSAPTSNAATQTSTVSVQALKIN